MMTRRMGFIAAWLATGFIAAGAFAQEQASAAEGLRVWNAEVLASQLDLILGGRGRPVGPITIIGARNGTFSGKVVAGSDQPIKGLRAAMSDLAGPGGGKIASTSILVRYPAASGMSEWNSISKAVAHFDALLEAPPEEVPLLTQYPGKRTQWPVLQRAYQPVWVTVQVPADAKPGEYEGRLTIATEGAKPIVVGVKLRVHDFRLPDPPAYTTCVDFVQSPETVSMQYDVPLWSEKHFELMGKSLELLRKAGNRSVNLYFVCETNHGNSESMVRWIKDGDGYRHDFSIMEKYLDTVEKHMGKPKRVFLYVWDYQYNERAEPEGFRGCVEASTGEVLVSSLNAEGQVTPLKLPKYADPKSKALWKPAIDGAMERLKKRGLENALLLGWASDGPPSKEIVSLFAELAPGVPWAVGSHSFYSRQDREIAAGGSPVKYATLVSAARDIRRKADPAAFFAWKDGDLVTTAYYRGMRNNSPITDFRFMADRPTEGGVRGAGRIGADFWPVMKDNRGRVVGAISARYPQSGWRNLDVRMTLLEPGPDGAVATTRFEMLREGIQECEARLFIEEALFRQKIAGPLAERCKGILDTRTRVLDDLHKAEERDVTYEQKDEIYERFLDADWQALTDRLYSAASDVARELGVK